MAKILLVEDDKLISRMVCLRLNWHGHQVETAFNGQEGVDKGLTGGFDLILMDMNMPIMDGHEAARTLCSKAYAGIITAITASVMVKETDQAIESGCNSIISKPIGADFEERVQQILDTAQ